MKKFQVFLIFSLFLGILGALGVGVAAKKGAVLGEQNSQDSILPGTASCNEIDEMAKRTRRVHASTCAGAEVKGLTVSAADKDCVSSGGTCFTRKVGSYSRDCCEGECVPVYGSSSIVGRCSGTSTAKKATLTPVAKEPVQEQNAMTCRYLALGLRYLDLANKYCEKDNSKKPSTTPAKKQEEPTPKKGVPTSVEPTKGKGQVTTAPQPTSSGGKCGLNSYQISAPCAAESGTYKYEKMKYACYDDFSGVVEGDGCKTSDEWLKIASENCKGHCR